jgi:hypothetical protein
MRNPAMALATMGLLLGGGAAYGDVITPSDDTYVRYDNTETHGGEPNLVVKQSGGGSGSTVRKALIEFPIENASKVTEAEIYLDVQMFNDTGGATSAGFFLWGIEDGASGENVNEATATYGAYDHIFSEDSNGVHSWHVFCPSSDDEVTNCPNALAYFVVRNTDLNTTIRISNAQLLEFVNADTNGRLTFVITRYTNSGSLNTAFASKESTVLNGPRLAVESEESIAVGDDLHVRYGDSVSYGGDSNVYVKYTGGTNNRWGFFEFNLGAARDVEQATLYLDLTTYAFGSGGTPPASTTFNVFAIRDDNALENLSESANYSAMSSIVELSTDGAVDSAVESLGTLTVSAADLNGTVAFTSQALADFITDDQDGRISLMLTRAPISGINNFDFNTGFASGEYATVSSRPSLALRYDHGDASGVAQRTLMYRDVDHDGEEDLILVVEFPGGGGAIVHDPWLIAASLLMTGPGLGDATDFWEALSGEQQGHLLWTMDELAHSISGPSGSVSAGDLEGSVDAVLLSAEGNTGLGYVEVEVATFEGDLDLAIEDGSFGFSVRSSVVSFQMTNEAGITTEIEIGSAAAAYMVTKNSYTVGAEANLVSVRQTIGDEGGTYGGVSTGLGEGFWFDMAAGRSDQYGFTLSVPGIPIGVEIYIKGSDAVAAWEAIEYWVGTAADELVEWTEGAWQDSITWADGTMVIVADAAEDAVIWIQVEATGAYMVVEQAGQQVEIWFADATSTTAQGVSAAVGATVDGIEDATGAAEAWLTSSTSAGLDAVTSAMSDASGWIVGTVDDAGDAIDDAWDTFKCGPSCWF